MKSAFCYNECPVKLDVVYFPPSPKLWGVSMAWYAWKTNFKSYGNTGLKNGCMRVTSWFCGIWGVGEGEDVERSSTPF